MDRSIAGLIGAMGALAIQTSHAASPPPNSIEAATQARSYAELLTPIPDALALSRATPPSADLASAADLAEVADAPIERVQYVAHHHHHHYRYRRRRYHHHHHHHHNDD